MIDKTKQESVTGNPALDKLLEIIEAVHNESGCGGCPICILRRHRSGLGDSITKTQDKKFKLASGFINQCAEMVQEIANLHTENAETAKSVLIEIGCAEEVEMIDKVIVFSKEMREMVVKINIATDRRGKEYNDSEKSKL